MAVRIPDPDAINLQLPGASAGIAGSVPRVNVEAGAQALQGAIVKFSDLALQAAEDASKDAALDRRNKAEAEIQDLLYNPEKGYFNRKGQAATEGLQDLDARIREVTTKHREGLNNRALSFYEPSVAGRVSEVRGMALRHANQQAEEFAKSAFSGAISNYQTAAARGEEITAEKADELDGLIGMRAKREGLTGDALKQFYATAWGQVREAQIDKLLADGKTEQAKEVYDAVVGKKGDAQLTAKQVETIGVKLGRASDFVAGGADADEALKQEMSRAQAESYFRSQAKGNKNRYAEAAAAFAAKSEAVQKDFEISVGKVMDKFTRIEETDGAWAAYNTMRKDPAFVGLSGKAFAQAQDYMKAQVEHAESRGRARKSEIEEAKANDPETLELMSTLQNNPQILSQMDQYQISFMSEKIGKQNAAALRAMKSQLNTATGRYKLTEDDAVKYALPSNTGNSATDKRVRKIYKELADNALAHWKAENPGQVPDEQTKAGFFAHAARKVKVPGALWGTNEMSAPEAVMRGFRVIDEIPGDFIAGVEQVAKKKGMKLSDDDIRRAWDNQVRLNTKP